MRSFYLKLIFLLIFLFEPLLSESPNKLVEFISSGSLDKVDLKNTPFFPSPGNTLDGEYIESYNINNSLSCGQAGCHPDIYHQWESSAHRNSSFNNPFYKKSVEYLVSTGDTAAVRWCGSCHDPIMLYSGLQETFLEENMKLPEASAGVTCEVCHGMVDIPDITGNGNYVLDKIDNHPALGRQATLKRLKIKLNPKKHSANMLKPLHKQEEFCASCHKVSLDEPINHYRWMRGQNEYDAWQNSGVSHNAVASFYKPPVALDCTSCHMSTVSSTDAGNKNGNVKNHWFPGANTALPALKSIDDKDWIKRTSDYLSRDRIAVDIFSVKVDGVNYYAIEDNLKLKPGQEVEFHIIVRTLNVGHSFPGGTIDSNEAWLQIIGKLKNEKIIFSSGLIDSNKFVDPSSHFFRGALLDANGEFILKRNPHEWRTTLYKNIIPPGSADIIRYNWKVPDDFNSEIQLTASVMYRKFNREITIFSLDELVDLPVVNMASDKMTISSNLETSYNFKSHIRFNDYGIALLRQNKLGESLSAFEKVIDINPLYSDGYINASRVLIKQGNFERAKIYLKKAIEIDKDYPKPYFFMGLIYKTEGDFDSSITNFNKVLKNHPKDRNVLKNIGQAYYLKDDFKNAKESYEDVLKIDPEDHDAHYNLMLINRNLGNIDLGKFHGEKYLKYKPDENARSISRSARLKYPYANNEAQQVHSHSLK